MKIIKLNGRELSLNDFVNIVRYNYNVELDNECTDKINIARSKVDEYVENKKVVYGITTGFGVFSEISIEKDRVKELQRNLIISHSTGVGEPFDIEVAKGIMVLRVNALIKGNSGVRLSTINTLIDMINKNVIPYIPSQGSLGASGDLAPLSHMVLVMIGLGKAYYNGKLMEGKAAMDMADISTIELEAKEGLGLINGTQAMTSVGALVTYDAIKLYKLADLASGLTFEALNGITCALGEEVHEIRGHMGQIDTAYNLREILKNSKRTTKQGEIRVQDAYSLRCTPQVHGASKDAIKYVKEKCEIEFNAVTDNPLIFPEKDKVISAGNFHGQPMAISFDFIKIAISELANISERRIERLVNPSLNGNLPGFLVNEEGVNSGFMIAQYSAAALVSENKVIAHPASVDSIPSSGNQEDHVSMGTIAARQASDILKNAYNVLSIELLCAAQAIDLSNGSKDLGLGTNCIYNKIRENVKFLDKDRVLYEDFEKIYNMCYKSRLIDEIELETIKLK